MVACLIQGATETGFTVVSMLYACLRLQAGSINDEDEQSYIKYLLFIQFLTGVFFSEITANTIIKRVIIYSVT